MSVLQGDRGFDGLPGLPGEKGHRVSERFPHHTAAQIDESIGETETGEMRLEGSLAGAHF